MYWNWNIDNSNNIYEKQSYFVKKYDICYREIFFYIFMYSKKGERYNKKIILFIYNDNIEI